VEGLATSTMGTVDEDATDCCAVMMCLPPGLLLEGETHMVERSLAKLFCVEIDV
jgi:hypothetical protein